MSDLYVTVDEVRSSVGLEDTLDDAHITRAVRAASRAADKFCRRRFWLDTADVSRTFTAVSSKLVVFRNPDLATLVSVKTDHDGDGVFERTWAATDYRLEPLNADADDRPFTHLKALPTGLHRFPREVGRVEVTGKWGWPAVPAEVTQATLLVANRLLKRTKDAPFGVAPISVMEGVGVRLMAKIDADGEVLLSPLRRMVMA